jgi:dihydroorotase-like cyclic amidohydrolase
MNADLVVKNALVVGEHGVFPGGVAMAEGVIIAIGADRWLPAGETTIDARGRMLLAGAIDPHVHLGVGGTADEAKLAEDFRTETRAAATGGITTFVTNHEHACGPSYITTVLTGEHNGQTMTLLDKAKAFGEERSVVDFRFTGLPQTRENLDEIPELVAQGVSSFKFYPSYQGEEAAEFGIKTLDWGFIFEGFERVAAARTESVTPIAMVHCEEPYICAVLKDRLRAAGQPGSLGAWADSRPPEAEAMQIFDVGMVAKITGARAYVVHTSSQEGTDTIRYLKDRGVDIIGETCTHYLMLTRDYDLERWAKVNPPIRGQADQDRLWQALTDGTHELVGSDDCGTYTRAQKLDKDFWDAIPGFSDMAATPTLLASEGVRAGRLTWEQMSRVISANPAAYYGMYPKKGVIRVGSDADLMIFDQDEEWELSPEALNYTSDFSIYQGRKAVGRPVTTIVRGVIVADGGKIMAAEGHGSYVAHNSPAEL